MDLSLRLVWSTKEFQDSHAYTEKTCLEKKKINKNTTTKPNRSPPVGPDEIIDTIWQFNCGKAPYKLQEPAGRDREKR